MYINKTKKHMYSLYLGVELEEGAQHGIEAAEVESLRLLQLLVIRLCFGVRTLKHCKGQTF